MTRTVRTALLLAGSALLLGPPLPPPCRAAPAGPDAGILVAVIDNWDGWNDYNWTIMQMQRESISSQEEQAREAGRAVRRNELEKAREKSSAERQEYFDSILAASQASLRAPRGVHYRKPGYTSADPPGENATSVVVAGAPYIYDQGVFWLQQGADYLVVTAPAGAVVSALPRGAIRVGFGDGFYWYFFGTFFAAQDGAFAVVKPPPGITVYYLPDGYTREKAGGVDVYRFGETLFKPVFVQGVLAYQVVSDR
ncbi:MAG TPA: DUF6515 family protein [Candidatus Methanoperedens sp.]|nr:DUF6515 family protein [Candidatus Methanoperedens sp.]